VVQYTNAGFKDGTNWVQIPAVIGLLSKFFLPFQDSSFFFGKMKITILNLSG
jgi:hypothetical protein